MALICRPCFAQSAHMPRVRLRHRALGRRVGRNAGTGELALHRSDVDDLALAARDHVPGDGLADVEDARNVGAEQLLPLLDGKSSSGERNCMPALLTRMSIAPSLSIVATPSGRPRRRDIESATATVCRGRGLLRRRRQACCARGRSGHLGAMLCEPCAMASPIPWEDPVMSARLPARSNNSNATAGTFSMHLV